MGHIWYACWWPIKDALKNWRSNIWCSQDLGWSSWQRTSEISLTWFERWVFEFLEQFVFIGRFLLTCWSPRREYWFHKISVSLYLSKLILSFKLIETRLVHHIEIMILINFTEIQDPSWHLLKAMLDLFVSNQLSHLFFTLINWWSQKCIAS